jgi:hypothetical protein
MRETRSIVQIVGRVAIARWQLLTSNALQNSVKLFNRAKLDGPDWHQLDQVLRFLGGPELHRIGPPSFEISHPNIIQQEIVHCSQLETKTKRDSTSLSDCFPLSCRPIMGHDINYSHIARFPVRYNHYGCPWVSVHLVTNYHDHYHRSTSGQFPEPCSIRADHDDLSRLLQRRPPWVNGPSFFSPVEPLIVGVVVVRPFERNNPPSLASGE